MLIGDNSVVSINYTLRDDNGEILDQSPEGQPMVYLHGVGGIIPGLEAELTGKVAGGEFKVSINADEAYGQPNENLIQQVPREAFPADMELAAGMQFQAQTEGGPMPVIITAVEGDSITVDGNHPLAGMNLHFEGSVAEVRQATEDELAHGHVHGPNSNH